MMVWDVDIGPGSGTTSRSDSEGLLLKLLKATKGSRHGVIRVRIGVDLLRKLCLKEGDSMRLSFNRTDRLGLVRRVNKDERGWRLRGNGARKNRPEGTMVSLHFLASTGAFPEDLREILSSVCKEGFAPGEVHDSEEGITFSYAPIEVELQHSGA